MPRDASDDAAPTRLPHHHRAVARLALTALAFVAGATLLPLTVPRPAAPVQTLLFGYVAGAAMYLALAGRILWRTSARDVERHALADDPGRTSVLVFILGSSVAVIGGALTLLRGGGRAHPGNDILLALMLASTALAWLVTNTAFALHYAHLNVRARHAPPGDGAPAPSAGFQFPGTEPPDGLDFAYFSFTIGMTFQVSDVQVMTSTCRRAVLGHGLLAFGYNTLLIALVVNTALGQVQR